MYDLPKAIEKFRNPPLPLPPFENHEKSEGEDSDALQGDGMKINNAFNIFDFWTRVELLLGLKLSGHTDTLTEGSNLIDEVYKKAEIQNEQQFRNALDNFSTPLMELPNKVMEQLAFNTKPKIEEYMLVVSKKSIQ